MHIVRWLFSHPISFAWILAIIAILLNWGLVDKKYGGSEQSTTANAGSAVVQAADSSKNTKTETQAAAESSVAEKSTTEQSKAPSGPVVESDLLREARTAYWKKDYDGATQLYTKLIEQDPNPSHKGELANVFWKMGNTKDAANLYIEIAPWLMENGRTSELVNMKVYVEMTDPEQAKKLGELLGQQ